MSFTVEPRVLVIKLVPHRNYSPFTSWCAFVKQRLRFAAYVNNKSETLMPTTDVDVYVYARS